MTGDAPSGPVPQKSLSCENQPLLSLFANSSFLSRHPAPACPDEVADRSSFTLEQAEAAVAADNLLHVASRFTVSTAF